MVQALVALVATVAALAGAGSLAPHALSSRRTHLIVWSLTLLFLGVSLGAMTIGLLAGFSSPLFRIMEIGGALIAPVCLALGLIELISYYVQVRFATWLIGVSYSVVALVVLTLDPIQPTLGKSMPDPGKVYDVLPTMLIGGAAFFVIIALVVGAGITANRARNRDRTADAVLVPVALVTLAGVLNVAAIGYLPGLLKVLGLAAAAGLVWYAANQTLPTEDDEDEARPERSHRAPAEAKVEHRVMGAPVAPQQRQPAPPAPRPAVEQPAAARPMFIDEEQSAGVIAGPLFADEPLYAADDDVIAGPLYGLDDPPYEEDAAMHHPTGPHGFPDPAPRPAFPEAAPRGYPERPAQPQYQPPPPPPISLPAMGGTITVYTLLEGREGYFDRLAAELVRHARAVEPDTLIFTFHEVTGAPTQRISYQLFRDAGAQLDHQRQPHVQQFLADSRPFVLATNVIELNLTSAKVAPFPSLQQDHR